MMAKNGLPKIAIVVGPKGRGSNMRAIVEACQCGEVPAEVGVVISPKDGTPAVKYASDCGIPVRVIDPVSEDFIAEFLRSVEHMALVCLAGYLRLLPSDVVAKLRGRLINIHPALLPDFGGPGMYGIRVHQAVIASGVKESGCTVHHVSENYDEGEPILQLRCDVLASDDAETLAARVLDLEHLAYPAAIKMLLARK